MKFLVLMSVYKNNKVTFLNEVLDSLMNQTVLPGDIVLVKESPLSNELNEWMKTN